MTATAAWTEISPANSDNINQGAQQIRNLRRDVRERLEIDHVWNVSTSTDGQHKKLTMPSQSSRPSTTSGFSEIWAEGSAAASQPYMKDGAGNVRQLGVPVGTICAYLPGYFVDGSNGTYTAVAMTLPDGWYLCEGGAPNDALSPIWNSATRYVPNISDARFLSGNTAANRGVIDGVNTIPAHTSGSTFANHTHTIDNTTVAIDNHTFTNQHFVTGYPTYTFTVPSHNHAWLHTTGGKTYTYNSLGAQSEVDNVSGSGTFHELFSSSSSYTINNPISPISQLYTNTATGSGTCVKSGNLTLLDHTGTYTHSVTAHNHTVTSSGSGAVTIGSDHAANSNMPAYMSVSFIIKIK